jgi:hypothetical protein
MEPEAGTLTLDKETEALAHRLAIVKGQPVRDVIKAALESSAREAGLNRRRTEEEKQEIKRKVDEIARQFQRLPLLDTRDPHTIIEYDEWGLPT